MIAILSMRRHLLVNNVFVFGDENAPSRLEVYEVIALESLLFLLGEINSLFHPQC